MRHVAAETGEAGALCGNCGGIWLDTTVAQTLGTNLVSRFAHQAADQSLAEVRRARALAATDAHTDRSLPCPMCGGNLGKHKFPPFPVEIDRCLMDGMFFDRGELATVLGQLGAHRGTARRLYEVQGRQVTVALATTAGAAAFVDDELVETVADVAVDVVVDVGVELVFDMVLGLFD
jgi:Zn-finger nucleic acid-binding protein